MSRLRISRNWSSDSDPWTTGDCEAKASDQRSHHRKVKVSPPGPALTPSLALTDSGPVRKLCAKSGSMKRAQQFRPAGAPSREDQKRKADRWRGNASERGYGHRWQKARQTHLFRSPLCVGCEAVGRIEPATVVDHVEPHRGDSNKFWDTSMWQSCCQWHHDSIKQSLELLYKRGRIPLSELWLTSPTAKRLTLQHLALEAEG